MKVTVVKIGGNIVDNPAALELFLKNFQKLEGPKVLIHGSGCGFIQSQPESSGSPKTNLYAIWDYYSEFLQNVKRRPFGRLCSCYAISSASVLPPRIWKCR